MAFKVTLVLCGLVLTIQTTLGQCLGRTNSLVENNVIVNSAASAGLAGLGLGAAGLALNNGISYGGLGLGNTVIASPAYIDLSAVSAGGLLPTSCVGPIIPGGLSVLSDNAIEGALLVSGQLPFLSAVALEGGLASAGSGAASWACGNGNIGITSESAPASLLSGAALLPGVNGLGRGGQAGLNRCGCL